jgi:hypothetical protein
MVKTLDQVFHSSLSFPLHLSNRVSSDKPDTKARASSVENSHQGTWRYGKEPVIA